jgi:8-oxo-dGTP pyrophosphatase MutT (NUDIX family)
MDERPASREVFHGKLITVRVETVPQPIGGTRDFEIVEHPDAVAVVAVRPAANGLPEVALVRQQRPAVARELWEIPAGLVDRGEERDERETAARELREETGYQAERWVRLTRELPSPGFSNEAISIFLAEDLYPATGAAPDRPADPTEIEAVRWLPLGEAVRLGETGEIEDGKTVLGLTLAAARLGILGGEEASEMPLDPTNAPFARRAPYRAGATAGLSIDNLLLEEFNYISVTAYQAMEDRARMFNLYLILMGVVATAVGAVFQIGQQLGAGEAGAQALLVALLVIGALLGTVFFVMLIRLRQAFRSSLLAMNRIKEYYINRFRDDIPDIGNAFPWQLKSMPAGERIGSVTFLVCGTVALIGALCLSAAAAEAFRTWWTAGLGPYVPGSADARPWIFGIALGLAYLIVHIVVYRRNLSKAKEQRDIQRAEQAMEGNRLRGQA